MNSKEAERILGKTAQLEFKQPVMEGNLQARDEKTKAPLWESAKTAEGETLTGEDLKDANIGTNQAGQWTVSLEFNAKGAQKFGELTEKWVGKPMAIYFDGEEISAPVINEPIYGGKAEISGGGESGFSPDEAKTMVDLLKAGALPVPSKIIQENTVGPTLGAVSIEKSKTASIIGVGLVMLFMLLMYRLPGLLPMLR